MSDEELHVRICPEPAGYSAHNRPIMRYVIWHGEERIGVRYSLSGACLFVRKWKEQKRLESKSEK